MQAMTANFSGILIMLVFAGGLSLLFILLTQALGPKNKTNPVKEQPYECGMTPFESPGGRHAVKFYLVGMLFVIFDIELIFLFPWAVVFREIGMSAFLAALFFLIVFELGFVYAWRKGALQWK